MEENWIRTDEVEDVAGSIRHIIRSAQFVDEDCQAWKWMAIALHSALQGACVCHLTTTAVPVGAVTESNKREWLTYFENSRTNSNAEPPRTRLMNLPDLLKTVRKPHSAGDGSNVAGIAITDSELCWLRRFHNDIRNQFVHFEPMGWSIEVSGIPKIATLVARIITEMEQIGYAFRHLDKIQRKELHRNLQTLASIGCPT